MKIQEAKAGTSLLATATVGVLFVSSMEEFEMDKRRKALDRDVASLVDKYLRAMEWDIPEVDEPKARQMILDEIEQAISRLKGHA